MKKARVRIDLDKDVRVMFLDEKSGSPGQPFVLPLHSKYAMASLKDGTYTDDTGSRWVLCQ